MQGRILIIDRDPSAWRDIQRAGSVNGCEVVCVPDLPAAVSALAEGAFELVLCDLRAPDGGSGMLVSHLVRGFAASAPEFALKPARKRFEIELIRRALRATGGNRTRAARLLEISHRALLYKLKEYELGD